MKQNVLGPKHPFLGQSPLFWGQKQGFPNILNIRNIRNTFYSVFTEYITSKLYLYFCKKTRSDSNLNQKFDYEFGSQGLSGY